MSWLGWAPFFDGNDGLVLLILARLVRFLFCQDLCLTSCQQHLNRFRQIFDDVESVGALNGLGSAFACSGGIFASPIATDYRQVWLLTHPPCCGFRLAVREEIYDAVALQVH